MSPSDLLPVCPITGYDCDEISLKIFMITVFLVEMISNVHNLILQLLKQSQISYYWQWT